MKRTDATPYVLVATAVTQEAAGLIERLSDAVPSTLAGRRLVTGTLGHRKIRVMITGPGMVNTAQSLTAAIETERPGMILMCGCAGAFEKQGVGVGDLAVACEENDAHLGVESPAGSLIPDALPFPVAHVDGCEIRSRVELDPELADRAAGILKRYFTHSKVRVRVGPFVTVSTITATRRTADGLSDAFGPCMENMEGVAAALVAKHYGLPFLEVRCASNLVGKREREAWDLPTAFKRSAEAAAVCLKHDALFASILNEAEST